MQEENSEYNPHHWRGIGKIEDEQNAVTGTDTGTRLVLVPLISDLIEIRLKTFQYGTEKQGLTESEEMWKSTPRILQDFFKSHYSSQKLKVVFLTRARIEECLQISLRQCIFSPKFLVILRLQNIRFDLNKQSLSKALSHQPCLETIELVSCTLSGNIILLMSSFRSLKGLILDWSHFPNDQLDYSMLIFGEMKNLVWLEIKDNDMQRVHWINLFRKLSSSTCNQLGYTLFYGGNFLGIEPIEWVRFLDDVIPTRPFTVRQLRN